MYLVEKKINSHLLLGCKKTRPQGCRPGKVPHHGMFPADAYSSVGDGSPVPQMCHVFLISGWWLVMQLQKSNKWWQRSSSWVTLGGWSPSQQMCHVSLVSGLWLVMTSTTEIQLEIQPESGPDHLVGQLILGGWSLVPRKLLVKSVTRLVAHFPILQLPVALPLIGLRCSLAHTWYIKMLNMKKHFYQLNCHSLPHTRCLPCPS